MTFTNFVARSAFRNKRRSVSNRSQHRVLSPPAEHHADRLEEFYIDKGAPIRRFVS